MAPKQKGTSKRVAPIGGSAKTSAANKTSKPKWPAISPVLPAEDLEPVQLWQDQIIIIPKLWTASLCKTYVSFLSTLPLTTTPGKPRRGEAVRVNDRFQVEDADFAARLWSETALRNIVSSPTLEGRQMTADEAKVLWGGEVLGLNSNIRIYRYTNGQFFDRHYDESNKISFPSADDVDAVPAKTTWTLLLYLTAPATGCQGGETVFYPEASSKREPDPPPVVAELDAGMALLHKHGQDCLLHEGREVLEGEKWVIRSDLCVKK